MYINKSQVYNQFIRMDHLNQHAKCQVMWYFYNQGQLDKSVQEQINKNYAELGINVEKPILKNLYDIKSVIKSQLWQQTALSKLAIFDLYISKQSIEKQLKRNNDIQAQLELRKLQEILKILQEQKQKLSPYFYNRNQQFQALVNDGFNQMTKKRDKQLQLDFMQATQYNWKQTFTFFIKSFSALSDRHMFQQSSSFNQNPTLEKYISDSDFQTFIAENQRCLHLKNHLENIGYQMKKIYKQIKNNYLKKQEYLDLKNQITGWKLVKNTQMDIYQKDGLYINKTFGIYHDSLKSIFEGQSVSSQSNYLVYRLILRNSSFPQQSLQRQYSKFNHGFSKEGDKIIINPMNIFQLKKIEKRSRRLLQKGIGQEQLQIQQKLKVNSQDITFLQFELIPYSYFLQINRSNNLIEFEEWSKKLFKFIRNYFENCRYEISLENSYLENDQFELAAQVLRKKTLRNLSFQRQSQEKVGKQQNNINLSFKSDQTAENIQKMAKLCKDLQDQQSYLICMKKYTKKICQSTNLFKKYIIKGNILIQMSLIKGFRKQAFVGSVNQHLNQILSILEYLGSILSHQTYQHDQNLIYSQEDTSIFSCCFKNGISDQNILAQDYDKKLMLELKLNKIQLTQLKQQFCSLFYKFLEAIKQLQLYGDTNEQLIIIKEDCKKIKNNVKIVEKAIEYKLKKSKKSQSIIKDKYQLIKECHRQIKDKLLAISQIKYFPMKQTNYIAKKSIICQDETSQLVNWTSTGKNIKSMVSQLKEAQQSFQNAYQSVQKSAQSQFISHIYEECSEIYKDQIAYRRENHYNNNSILMLALYKKQVQICFQLRKLQQFQKILKIFHCQKKTNVLVFKADTHKKAAILYLQKQQFDQTIYHTQKSAQYYFKQEAKVPKNFMDLFLLKIKAKVRKLAKQIKLQPNSSKIKKEINILRYEIQKQKQNWSIFSKNINTIFQIQFDLINIQLKELQLKQLQVNQRKPKYSQMIDLYKKIEQKRSLFYDQKQLSSVMIYIDIVRIHEQANKLKGCAEYYKKIIDAFQHPLKSLQSQMEEHKWVKNLILFFQQRVKGLKFLQILPARKYIEDCLFDLKQIKKKGKLNYQLNKYYDKVYHIYTDFMKKQLKCFPLKPKQDEFSQIYDEKQQQEEYENDKSSLFNKVYWLFFTQQKHIQNYQRQIRQYYNNKINPIVNTLSSLNQSLDKTGPKSNIKLVISLKYLSSLIINDQKDIQFNNRQNIINIKVITSKNNPISQQVRLFFLKNQIKCRIDVIKQVKQIMDDFYKEQSQINGFYKIYSNVMFYIQGFGEKIHQHHIIVYSSLSQQKTFVKQGENPFHLLKQSFLAQKKIMETEKDKQNLKLFLQNGQKLRNLRKNICENGSQQQQNDQLLKICKQSINCYKQQSILYEFMNNTLRLIFQNTELDLRALQDLIYLPNRSIQTLYNNQIQNNRFPIGKRLILWRIAQMSSIQFDIFLKQKNRKPFVQFLSFVSTTNLFSWVLKKLYLKFQKSINNQAIFQNAVIFRIEVNITKQLIDSPLNNGFYEFEDHQQPQILFNVFNVFQVQNVQKYMTIQSMIKAKNLRYISNQQMQPSFFQSEIRVISLKMQDFSKFIKEEEKQKSHYKLFRQVTSAFLKKRNKYQSTEKRIKISSFSTIQAYESLSRPAKAVHEILQKISTSGNYFSQDGGMNMMLRASENCLKMGNLKLARQYIKDYLPKFQEHKKEIEQQNNRIKITNQIYEMKFSLIKFFINEKIDIQQYDENIQQIEKQLRQTVSSLQNSMEKSEVQMLNYKTKEIYLRLHRSISLYYQGNMMESIDMFDSTLEQLNTIIKQLKDNDLQLTSKNSIKQFCEKIISQMKQRIFQYSCLKKNYQQQQKINYSKELLLRSSAQLHSLSQYSDLQSNAISSQFASSKISEQFVDKISQQNSICQELQILSEVSSRIQDQELRNTTQSQKTKQLMKDANFQLLGKLQIKNNKILHDSKKGMQSIMKKYSKMIIKMMNSQIRYLQQKGHTRQSSSLIKKYNKMIKQRLKQPNLDYNQVKKQIKKNLFYCHKDQSQIKNLEICKANLLMAQLEYLLSQKHFLQISHKQNLKKQLQFYRLAQKFLIQARIYLRNAYDNEEQQYSSFLCCFIKIRNKLEKFQTKKHKMMRLSDQNLKIHVLGLKILHGKFILQKSQKKVQKKQKLINALEELGNLVNCKKYIYDVLNEEIFVYEMYSLYGLILTKNISFSKYFQKFIFTLKRKDQLKGENNIENGESCLQLFQLLDSSLKSFVKKEDFQLMYSYIQRGTWNCENNDLFWRFVICKFNRIKQKKQIEDYIWNKLSFLLQILQIFKVSNNVTQIAVKKIKKSYMNFHKNVIEKKKIKSQRINDLTNKIEYLLKKLRQKLTRQQNQQNQQSQQIQPKQQNLLNENNQILVQLHQQKRQKYSKFDQQQHSKIQVQSNSLNNYASQMSASTQSLNNKKQKLKKQQQKPLDNSLIQMNDDFFLCQNLRTQNFCLQ